VSLKPVIKSVSLVHPPFTLLPPLSPNSSAKTSNHKTPIVESTGSGGGLKLFCAGIGTQHPDITNASRAIKKSEIKRCAENCVNEITEVKIGYDGIVFANAKTAPAETRTQEYITDRFG
jgi:phosphate transport system substrate-binding protein